MQILILRKKHCEKALETHFLLFSHLTKDETSNKDSLWLYIPANDVVSYKTVIEKFLFVCHFLLCMGERNMINEIKLQVFCSLAETLSFTSTAKELYLSQQTVSRLISELEDEIGIKLFERSSRYVKLTAAGHRYQQVVVEMLWMHKRVVSELNKDFGGGNGLFIDVQLNLDIGHGGHLAMAKLREKYNKFRSATSRISPNYLTSRLLDHKSDIAILLDRFYTPDDRMESVVLFDTDYLLVSSKEAFPPDADNHCALLSAPLLFDTLELESPPSCAQRCQREVALLGLTPQETVWVNNADTAFSRAMINEGVVIASSADRISSGRGLVGYPTGKICHVLAVYRTNETDPLVKSYIQFLKEIYNDLNRDFKPATKPVEID